MSRYYNIPNKVNLPIEPSSLGTESMYNLKSKAPIIENEKKKSSRSWSMRHRHTNISSSKENTPPRRIATNTNKVHQAWQTAEKPSVSKADPRRMFNFIDINTDSRLSYLEFRAWMLIIDRTLTEAELLRTFNDVDQNGDGFIQYKEFKDYFGEDLLTGEPTVNELTALFNEIDVYRSGTITLDQLLTFFNKQSTLITKDEAHLFLGMVSDVGNENSISLKEFLKAMREWKV